MSSQENTQITLSEELFFLRLQGFIPEATFKNLFISLGKKVCTERSKGLVLDFQHAKIIPVACQKWMLEEWLPQLRKQYFCSYRVAVITSTDYFGKYSIESLHAQFVQKDFGIRSQVVTSEAEAREWINNLKT